MTDAPPNKPWGALAVGVACLVIMGFLVGRLPVSDLMFGFLFGLLAGTIFVLIGRWLREPKRNPPIRGLALATLSPFGAALVLLVGQLLAAGYFLGSAVGMSLGAACRGFDSR